MIFGTGIPLALGSGIRAFKEHVKARFSVVICTYNYAHLLPDALRTLGAQTCSDSEVLIVDDGSTDDTERVACQFRSEFRNFVYLKKPHSGLAATRNVGIQAATGSQVGFLDADDLWSPHYLETVQNTLDAHPQVELVFSNGLRVLQSGKIVAPIFAPGHPSISGPAKSGKELLFLCTSFCPSGLVFSKRLYDRVGPFSLHFDYNLGDDVDWVVRALTSGAHCAVLDQVRFLYRVHGANLTTQPSNFVEPWLKIFTTTLRDGSAYPDLEARAKQFTRQYALRVQGSCSSERGRLLLRKAMEALGSDVVLKTAYLLTYFGLARCLNFLRAGKRVLRRALGKPFWIDLSASPEALFSAVDALPEGVRGLGH